MNDINSKYKKKKKRDFFSGISLAFTFLLIALILFLLPNFFKYIIVTRIFMLIFTVVGIVGLGTELNKLFPKKKKSGFQDLTIGLGFGIIWIVIYYYFPIWWVNIITFPILFFAVYGLLLGFINISKVIIFSDISLKKKILVRILGQLLGIALVVLQILKILKII